MPRFKIVDGTPPDNGITSEHYSLMSCSTTEMCLRDKIRPTNMLQGIYQTDGTRSWPLVVDAVQALRVARCSRGSTTSPYRHAHNWQHWAQVAPAKYKRQDENAHNQPGSNDPRICVHAHSLALTKCYTHRTWIRDISFSDVKQFYYLANVALINPGNNLIKQIFALTWR